MWAQPWPASQMATAAGQAPARHAASSGFHGRPPKGRCTPDNLIRCEQMQHNWQLRREASPSAGQCQGDSLVGREESDVGMPGWGQMPCQPTWGAVALAAGMCQPAWLGRCYCHSAPPQLWLQSLATPPKRPALEAAPVSRSWTHDKPLYHHRSAVSRSLLTLWMQGATGT